MENPFKNKQGKKKILMAVVLLVGIFAFLPFISADNNVTLISPIDYNIITDGNNIYFNFTANFTGGLSYCELWGDWSGTWQEEYQWDIAFNGDINYTNYTIINIPVPVGDFIWNVYCVDYPPNNPAWALDNFHFTMNEPIPIINIVYPESIDYNINITELNYTSDGTYCWYSLDLGETNSTSVTCGINFTNLTSGEGTNVWTVYANNSLGNEISSSVTFVKDTVFPLISITYPQNIVYYGVVSTLNYLFSEIHLNTCWYSLDNGNTNISAMVCIGGGRGRGGGRGGCEGTWTCINLIELTSNKGSNTWTVWINDTAGNENSSSVNFVISSWTSETGAVVYNLMDSAGAGLGMFMSYMSQSLSKLLISLGFITVFIIIGWIIAITIKKEFTG
jgi:hypothetical protein